MSLLTTAVLFNDKNPCPYHDEMEPSTLDSVVEQLQSWVSLLSYVNMPLPADHHPIRLNLAFVAFDGDTLKLVAPEGDLVGANLKQLVHSGFAQFDGDTGYLSLGYTLENAIIYLVHNSLHVEVRRTDPQLGFDPLLINVAKYTGGLKCAIVGASLSAPEAIHTDSPYLDIQVLMELPRDWVEGHTVVRLGEFATAEAKLYSFTGNLGHHAPGVTKFMDMLLLQEFDQELSDEDLAEWWALYQMPGLDGIVEPE